MASGFGTSTDEMYRAGQHVLDVNDQVQAKLSQLKGQLAPLAGAWKGQAATAFATLMARWDADARKLNDALHGIGESIRGSSQTYMREEEAQAQAMSTITQALG